MWEMITFSVSAVLLLITYNPTQAAPANSELSSELSSRTEVAEWHSTYNTSELAFPETGECLQSKHGSNSHCSLKAKYVQAATTSTGTMTRGTRSSPTSLASTAPATTRCSCASSGSCHQTSHCHSRHLFHSQGVPVHQAGGTELRGGEEGQPVLSDHILPPRSVSNHSSRQKT